MDTLSCIGLSMTGLTNFIHLFNMKYKISMVETVIVFSKITSRFTSSTLLGPVGSPFLLPIIKTSLFSGFLKVNLTFLDLLCVHYGEPN